MSYTDGRMRILETLRKSIKEIGIKEIARRSGLSASTVSRINAGSLSPSLEVTERISEAAGFEIAIHARPLRTTLHEPRLHETLRILRRLKKTLSALGVKHVTVFGSVARGDDGPSSDIDLFIDYGAIQPKADQLLPIEGRIIEAFRGLKVDFISNLSTAKGKRLRIQIEKDGKNAF